MTGAARLPDALSRRPTHAAPAVCDARRPGEAEKHLHQLAVWREPLLFSDAERAALACTEAATELGPEGVPDEVWEAARAALDEVGAPGAARPPDCGVEGR